MSTNTKALPANIKELTSKPAAKALDDKYTVEILQQKLKDGGVRYLSADTKSVLIWRYMDMESMDFDANLNDVDTAPDNAPDVDITDDTSGIEPVAPNEPADAPVEPTNDTGAPKDEPKQDDVPANEPQTDEKQPNPATDDGKNIIDSATDVSADNTDIDSNHGHSDTGTTNRNPSELVGENAGMTTDPKTDDSAPKEGDKGGETKAPETNDDDSNYIVVENNGAWAFLETATRTMVPARKVTKIKPTSRATKELITRNINQYNSTRGKFLVIK